MHELVGGRRIDQPSGRWARDRGRGAAAARGSASRSAKDPTSASAGPTSAFGHCPAGASLDVRTKSADLDARVTSATSTSRRPRVTSRSRARAARRVSRRRAATSTSTRSKVQARCQAGLRRPSRRLRRGRPNRPARLRRRAYRRRRRLGYGKHRLGRPAARGRRPGTHGASGDLGRHQCRHPPRVSRCSSTPTPSAVPRARSSSWPTRRQQDPSEEGPLVELFAKTVSGDVRIERAPAPATQTTELSERA